MSVGAATLQGMDSLEGRITARLQAAVDHQVRAGTYPGNEDQGLAVREPGGDLVVMMTIDDVARIAASAAREWFQRPAKRKPPPSEEGRGRR